MHYDPIKESLDRIFNKSLFLRKLFYILLDILLLRTWHVHRALRIAGRQIPEKPEILDAGMGFGQYTWWMAKHRKKWKITAADIKSEQVAECNLFFNSCGISERVRAIEANLVEFQQPDTYNLILCVDVMEHIEEDRAVFSNFFSSLLPGGRLIISTPSDKGGSDVHDENEESFIGEHVRDGYSMTDITEKLSSAGFSNIQVSYTYGIPGSIAWRLSMKYPVVMLSLTKLLFIVLPFYYIVVMPFCLILNYLDLITKHRSGTGLLITAIKK
jgi:SAM-dependent methyltransferase